MLYYSLKRAAFPCEFSIQSLPLLRGQLKAFLKHIIFPMHLAIIGLCCCSEYFLSSMSSCLPLESNLPMNTELLSCPRQGATALSCYEGTIYTVDDRWHSSNLVRLVLKLTMWLESKIQKSASFPHRCRDDDPNSC